METNWEKYFGTPEKAAEMSIERFDDETPAKMAKVSWRGQEIACMKAWELGGWLGEQFGKKEKAPKEPKPDLPQGWHYIEDLQGDLDTGLNGEKLAECEGDIGEAITEIAEAATDLDSSKLFEWVADRENVSWMETAFNEERPGKNLSFEEIVSYAQYLRYRDDLYESLEASVENAAYEHVKKRHGAAAVEEDLVELIECFDPRSGDDLICLYEAVDEAIGVSEDKETPIAATEAELKAAAGYIAEHERVFGFAPSFAGAIAQARSWRS